MTIDSLTVEERGKNKFYVEVSIGEEKRVAVEGNPEAIQTRLTELLGEDDYQKIATYIPRPSFADGRALISYKDAFQYLNEKGGYSITFKTANLSLQASFLLILPGYTGYTMARALEETFLPLSVESVSPLQWYQKLLL